MGSHLAGERAPPQQTDQ